jgi:hypothetical protein
VALAIDAARRVVVAEPPREDRSQDHDEAVSLAAPPDCRFVDRVRAVSVQAHADERRLLVRDEEAARRRVPPFPERLEQLGRRDGLLDPSLDPLGDAREVNRYAALGGVTEPLEVLIGEEFSTVM